MWQIGKSARKCPVMYTYVEWVVDNPIRSSVAADRAQCGICRFTIPMRDGVS